jgi:hypothetical protein
MNKNSFLFTNFLGAIKDSLVKEGYSAKQTNHLLVANLMEIVNDTVHENGDIDHYVLKPVYRFLLNLQREENKRLQPEAYLAPVQQKMAANDYFISFLEKELSAIEANESKEETSWK